MWAADSGQQHKPPANYLWKQQKNFGQGDDMVTKLLNASGEVGLLRALNNIMSFYFGVRPNYTHFIIHYR